MTTRELMRWTRLHERRAHAWWRSSWAVAIIAGGVLAAFVAWRAHASRDSASASWLAGTLVAFALAFLRVPFHLYWRTDAALLAQLPIDGRALVDVALVRCVRAAAATTLACAIGALPLGAALFAHHLLLAGALGVAAAGLLPAVALWAAMLVAGAQHANVAVAMRVVGAVASPTPRNIAAAATSRRATASSGTVLGALPGFAATLVIVDVLIASPYLTGSATLTDVAPWLAALAGTSLAALVIARAGAAHVMGTILRDVSALDRQRLAPLEIRKPTALERAIMAVLGDAALPYSKDARLMRRRYPMAFALGALSFLVLANVASLIVNVDPGRRTEVVCLFDLARRDHRAVASGVRALHVFAP